MIPEAAMIFAAGFGTRMGDLTKTTPKPMLEVGGHPMIDHTVALLREAGVKRLVANTHYLPEKLEAHLKSTGVITKRESVILETGGGLRAARETLDSDPVITINPDVLWDGPNPVTSLCQAWKSEMSALLMLAPTGEGEPGDFSLENGQIWRNGPFRYTGLQIIRTSQMDEIEGTVFSLNSYWDLLLAAGPVHGFVYGGKWTDIGTEDALLRANRRLPS